jgi:hypothetical protein
MLFKEKNEQSIIKVHSALKIIIRSHKSTFTYVKSLGYRKGEFKRIPDAQELKVPGKELKGLGKLF